MKFDIEGRLPGLNEKIDAAQRGKGEIPTIQHDEANIHRHGGLAGETGPKRKRGEEG